LEKSVFPLLIADSTGVTTDRLYVPAIIKCKSKRRKVVDKLNIVAEYYPEKSAIVIANADAFLTSDPYSVIKMLNEIETDATILFADAGFDCEELYEKCFSIGIKPVIKQRKYDKKARKCRGKAREVFDEELYRKFRGIIEGVFGGLEIRRLLFTRYRKKSMRMKYIIAMAIVHNINTYMAISLFILIFSTTPFFLFQIFFPLLLFDIHIILDRKICREFHFLLFSLCSNNAFCLSQIFQHFQNFS